MSSRNNYTNKILLFKISLPGQFSLSVVRDSFNIYFWYVVLQEFIQIAVLYFLHGDFFLFSKCWEWNNEPRGDVIYLLFISLIESFLSPLVYMIVVSFMENGQLSESDSLEWAGDLTFLHLCILNVLKRRSFHSKILRPPGFKKKKSEFKAKWLSFTWSCRLGNTFNSESEFLDCRMVEI